MDNSTWTYPCELFETLVYQKNSGKFLEVSCWIESITQYVYLKKKKETWEALHVRTYLECMLRNCFTEPTNGMNNAAYS